MNPSIGQWTFRIGTTLAPLVFDLLSELQNQIDGGGAILWRPLVSACIGSLLVAYMHLARAGTVTAETAAEVATGEDKDDDATIEQTPGQVGG